MSEIVRADVCVVGGGPAGSATALFLARAGMTVVILDRARFPRDKPCAEYLSPEASRILSAMGVLDSVEQQASRLRGMRVRSPRGEWLHGEFRGVHHFNGYSDAGLAVRRTVLDSILLEAAGRSGARVIQSAIVRDVTRRKGRVTGVVAHGRAGTLQVEARMVVGADGLRSVVARRLGIARTLRWPRRLALIAHYDGVREMTDAGEMHVDNDGYFGLASVGTLTNVAVVVPASAGRSLAGSAARYMERWIAARPHLRDRFTTAERVGGVRATGPFASRVARAWAPGAAVVGDAADFFDPFTGEGIYAALRGAELLAPLVTGALEQASASEEALREYDRARTREFGGKWKVERLVALAVANPSLMNHLTAALARRKDLADLLVGVCGDFIPPAELFRARVALPLLLGPYARTAA